MKRSDITVGLRVRDAVNTPDMTYTWIAGGRVVNDEFVQWVCDNCDYSDQFLLYEDDAQGVFRHKFCIECAGLEDLEPIVSIVK